MGDIRVVKPGRKTVFVVDHKELKPLKDFEALELFLWIDENGMPEIVKLAAEQADE